MARRCRCHDLPRAVANPQLADLAVRLCRAIGYCGIVDMDWRFDGRDQRYKLVDFNPRMGAQFSLFETETGVDVVRALHLDLTGREVHASSMVDGRGIRVEHLDLPARLSLRRARRSAAVTIAPDDSPESGDLGAETLADATETDVHADPDGTSLVDPGNFGGRARESGSRPTTWFRSR